MTYRTDIKDRLLKRKQVADILGLSTRAVDIFAKKGILKKIILPFHVRATGFSENQVMELISKK